MWFYQNDVQTILPKKQMIMIILKRGQSNAKGYKYNMSEVNDFYQKSKFRYLFISKQKTIDITIRFTHLFTLQLRS